MDEPLNVRFTSHDPVEVHAHPDLQLTTAGLVLDMERALEEVRKRTPLGRMLVNVEHRAIEFVRQNAEAQRRRRQAARHRSAQSRLSCRAFSRSEMGRSGGYHLSGVRPPLMDCN
jgi:hypothetical protein